MSDIAVTNGSEKAGSESTEDRFVSREMKTVELLEKYPEVRELFIENGMFCTGCECAEAETLEQALAIHCMDIDAVIDLLNERIKNNHR